MIVAGGNFFMPQNSHSSIASFSAEEKSKTEGEGTELFSRPVGVLGLVWEGLVGALGKEGAW